MNIIFLSYINRSGSTYLANILSKSEQLCVCPEADILYDLFLAQPEKKFNRKELMKAAGILMQDNKFKAWKPGKLEWQSEMISGIQAFLQIIHSFREKYYPEAAYILFKHNKLLKLKENLQEGLTGKIYWLNLIRNPLAIYASQKITISPHTGKTMSKNPLEIVDAWNDFYNRAIRNEGEDSRILRYEQIIEDHTVFQQSIINWLSLKTENFGDNKDFQLVKWIGPEYLAIHSKICEKPDEGSLSKWERLLTDYEIYAIKKHITGNSDYVMPHRSLSVPGYMIYESCLLVKKRLNYLRMKYRSLKNTS